MPSTPSEFIRKNTIIQAGAGAGKTTELISVYTEFCKDFKASQGRLPKVIVCTFTRKATHEVKERILQKCLGEKNFELFDYTSKKNCVHISTIHGVLTLFLQQYGDYLGFDPKISITSAQERMKSFQSLVRKICVENSTYLALLEEFKFREVCALINDYLLEADNTHLLKIWSKEDFLKEGYRFSKTLYEDLVQIQKQLSLENGLTKSWASYLDTIEIFLRQHALALTQVQSPKLAQVDGIYAYENLKKIWLIFLEQVPKKPPYAKAKPPFAEELNQMIDEHLKSAKELCRDLQWDSQHWEKWEQIQSAFHGLFQDVQKSWYHQTLEESALSFHELEKFSLKLIEEHPLAADEFSKKWDFWMIDEYQDTSPTQEKILTALIKDRPQFVVGDPQQSIYLFRGAESSLFQKKIHTFLEGAGEFRTKTKNYRSTPCLVHFFNDVFSKDDSSFIKMEEVESKPAAESNAVNSVKAIDSSNAIGATSALSLTGSAVKNLTPIDFLIADPDIEKCEVENVLQRIIELKLQGYNYHEIAVLCRTNKPLVELSQLAFQHQIPVQLHQNRGFLYRREIIDAVCFLKFLFNPHDNENLFSLLRTPWVGLTDKELFAMATFLQKNQRQQLSFWSKFKAELAVQKSDQPNIPQQQSLQKLNAYLTLANTIGATQTLLRYLNDENFFRFSEWNDLSGLKEANIFKLIDMCEKLERQGTMTWNEFIRGLEKFVEKEEEDGDAIPLISPSRVNLMTIHASKGLQFPHVIVMDLHRPKKKENRSTLMFNSHTHHFAVSMSVDGQKIFPPFGKQVAQEFNLKTNIEFKRVFYVALTRAQKAITLSWIKDDLSKGMNQFLKFAAEENFPEEDERIVCFEDYEVRIRKKISNEATAQNQLSQASPQARVLPLPMVSSDSASHATLSVTQILSTPKQDLQNQTVLHKNLRDKIKTGILNHRLFEALKYLAPETLLADKALSENQKRNIEFLKKLNTPPLLQILKNGNTEWGFETKVSEQKIKGQIDLLGVVDDVLYIIDYKTGSSKSSAQALSQLRIYAEAIQSINQLLQKNESELFIFKKISLAALFVTDEKVVMEDF